MSYPGDDPEQDQELRKGQTVYLKYDEQTPGVQPYTLLAVGNSNTDYDYIIEGPLKTAQRVTVEEVIDGPDGSAILCNPLVLDPDTTSLPALEETFAEYELLGAEPSRAGQYINIKYTRHDNVQSTRKVPIVLWGHYLVKSYAGDKLMPIDTRTAIFPMIAMPGKLEPQRVTEEIFIDYYMA